MDSQFAKSISSELFTFVVGQARKEFTVHSGPLASLSSPLDRLMNGPMMEAKARKVDWSQVVDEDTFVRLCQYAYSCDYTPPVRSVKEKAETRQMASVSASKNEQQEPALSFYPRRHKVPPIPSSMLSRFNKSFPSPNDSHNEKSISTRQLQEKFCDLRERHAKLHSNAVSQQTTKFASTGNYCHPQGLKPDFLGHVKLYILADTYGILPLAHLVLFRLGAALGSLTPSESNMGEIVALVRFSYQRTRPNDPLRILVAAYVASVSSQIGLCGDLQDLLVEGGDFVCDLWKAIWN
ncbi:hypothetical protein P170DRAFT_476343 [Aspergillus steynii IBT 23096]|uniref:BTB domain-containing protein n=1 Tax=Aspergillus steynii IBT 23096 TaxID=1392250 RepID=A0A2I2G450_9EURO|nr:uncharacterized protein P170DRAFT_476343 [Aspergillus steynii IBT 23096]PLB47660.1 hypothetical protein P170DRAFT_476343 [Aspergillus steynii IBT 23096]